MIDSGEEWMVPLLEFRDFLASTQDPAEKPGIREHKRRNGRVEERDGHFVWGPYQPWFRKKLLRMLLETQVQVQRYGPDPNMRLISEDELHEIRRIWRTEMHDWEDSVPKIYHEVLGEYLPGATDEQGAFTGREKAILTRIAENHSVPQELVLRLVDLERQMYGMMRRTAMQGKIDATLSEDWRSREEVLRTAATLHNGLENS
jgi:DNA sulfur modification protein DndC